MPNRITVPIYDKCDATRVIGEVTIDEDKVADAIKGYLGPGYVNANIPALRSLICFGLMPDTAFPCKKCVKTEEDKKRCQCSPIYPDVDCRSRGWKPGDDPFRPEPCGKSDCIYRK